MLKRWNDEYYWEMGRAGARFDTAQKVRKLARRYKSLCEEDCNIGLTEKGESSRNRIKDQMRSILREAFPHRRYKLQFQGDPRGATVKWILHDGFEVILDL